MVKIILFSFVINTAVIFSQNILDNDSGKVYQEKEVIISATRTEKNADEIGRSVTVLEIDRTKNSIPLSIGEILTLQTGMYVIGAGQNPGMAQTIFTRGTASNHTTVMVDGVRIADPSTVNNTPDLSELSSISMNRLEVVRGTHSTLYGSSAIGGVVNFISQNSLTPGYHVSADITGGFFGKKSFLHSENLFLNFSDQNGFYTNAGISNLHADGIDATVDTNTNAQTYKSRDADGFRKTDFYGKIGFENEFGHYYLSYKKSSQKTDIDKAAFVDDDNYVLDFSRDFFTYGGSWKFSDNVNIQYIGGYAKMKRNSVNDSSIVDLAGNYDHTYVSSFYEGSTVTNEIQSNFHYDGFDGIAGVGYYQESMNNKTDLFLWSSFGTYQSNTDLDTLNLQTTTKSLFLHFNLSGTLLSKELQSLSIAVGGRHNEHNTFGTNITYEINPSLKVFEHGLIFLSYSTGFNAPSLYQLFAPDNYYTSSITRGNKNLKPETSFSYEIGYKHTFENSLKISATYFQTTVENFIEYVYLWDKNIGIDTLGNNFLRDDYRGDTYMNLGQQISSGVELYISTPITKYFFLAANVSIIKGTLKYNSSDINAQQTEGHHVQIYGNGAFVNKNVESKGLIRRPSTGNISLTYFPFDNFSLKADVRIVGSRDDVYYESTLGPYGALNRVGVDSYTVVDFSQKYQLSENILLLGKIENLFNTKYYEIKGFTTRGRGVFLNIGYSM